MTQDQQRTQASMAMLEKMGAFVDSLIEEQEEQERLEQSWRDRMIKPTADEEETE